MAFRERLVTVHELRFVILTVTSVPALAYVMNLSGRAATIGAASRRPEPVSPARHPSSAGSGSPCPARHLRRRALQVAAAPRVRTLARPVGRRQQLRRRPRQDDLPQNLTITCAAVVLAGCEGDLLRKGLPWSLGLLRVMCLIVVGRSTPVLGWTLP
ncbi:hypothetical protein GCM10010104_62060 [Streptomyces indiaensis]|uniref:Uncharacterized protein n=1 Tax=Streptomyces indiaensis TaxID=284033 RepID=A0ABN3EFQ3_9ACTN